MWSIRDKGLAMARRSKRSRGRAARNGSTFRESHFPQWPIITTHEQAVTFAFAHQLDQS